MINVLLVDDEFLALNLLENYVNEVPGLEIVQKVKSPLMAIDILNREPVDILFLDIQMPTLSGINLLKTLKHRPVTIFTTAYAEHAVDAYGLDAVDYLLKPFSFERFLQGVNKAKEYLRKREMTQSTGVAPVVDRSPDFISVKSESQIVKLFHNDILYIEGLKEYVRIVSIHGKHITLMSLKDLVELLPSELFIRTHKSYIVHMQKVKSIEGNILHLENDRIPVSREKKSEVVKLIFG